MNNISDETFDVLMLESIAQKHEITAQVLLVAIALHMKLFPSFSKGLAVLKALVESMEYMENRMK